jgi:DNA-binding MarR family transcriptional regulator
MTDKPTCTAFFSISKLLEDRSRKILEPHKIFQGQGKVLSELSRKDGMTQIEIAKTLDISPATVTNMVKRMEASKLVKRSNDKDDERMIRVRLSKEGTKAALKVDEAWKIVDKDLDLILSNEEQKQLNQLLIKIQTGLTSEKYLESTEPKIND